MRQPRVSPARGHPTRRLLLTVPSRPGMRTSVVPQTRQHLLADLDATATLAARVAALLREGDAILLGGGFGAGKTAFARCMLRVLTGDPALEVPSPSFTLLQSYETPRGMVHHFDLWRLRRTDDLVELGWQAARDDIVLVEWPERLGALLPDDALRIDLALAGETARSAALSGWPERLECLR